MRHKYGQRKLQKPTDQRLALLRNQVKALFQYGRVKTTEIRAKEVSRMADRLITQAKSCMGAETTPERQVAARRLVQQTIQKPPVNTRKARARSYYQQSHPEREVLEKLFAEIAPRYLERNGGYTRVVKGPPRRGDGTATAIVALVED